LGLGLETVSLVVAVRLDDDFAHHAPLFHILDTELIGPGPDGDKNQFHLAHILERNFFERLRADLDLFRFDLADEDMTPYSKSVSAIISQR
jgi:hypothetical protein